MTSFSKNGLPMAKFESRLENYSKRRALYRFGKNWGIPVDPKMNIFAVHTEDYEVDEVVGGLVKKGWSGLYITQDPPSFRCVVLPHHEDKIEAFLSDLEEVTNKIKVTA